MKKYLLVCFSLFWIFFEAQTYFNTGNSGSNVAEFYTINEDSTISYTAYNYGNRKEEVFTGKRRFNNKKEWTDFYSYAKPISLIKTNTPEDFRREIMHKTFLVERHGETIPYMFYGNALIEGVPHFSPHIRLGYPKYLKVPNNFYNNFELKQINGVNFLIYNQRIYLLKNENVLQEIFREAKITNFSSNIGNTQMSALLKVDDVNQMYGVSDIMGKMVLSAEFQDIMICADAILVKRSNLWYFYDLFGNKISKKGYRKILPLSIVEVRELVDQIQTKTGAALKYVVLENKDLKVIEDIYAESKESKFAYQYGIMSVCGTRSGPRYSQSIQIQLKENDIYLQENTYYENYPTNIEDMEISKTEKTQKISVKPEFGQLSFLNKTDAVSAYSIKNNNLTILMKRIKGSKEALFPITIRAEIPDYYQLYKSYPETEFFDKIESIKSVQPLLSLDGDYNSMFGLHNEDIGANNNFNPFVYFKIIKDGKLGFYSPFSGFMNYIEPKYTSLSDLDKRFMRFIDVNGKTGWLCETNEEFYD